MKKSILIFLSGIVFCLAAQGILAIVSYIYNEKNILDDTKIEFYKNEYLSTLNSKIKEEFKNGNYKKALELDEKFKTAQNILNKPDNTAQQHDYTDCLKQLVEINEKIKKDPKNYKLYAQKGDILSKPDSLFIKDSNFCFDRYAAYESYSQALKLNPDAKNLYEKRADAILASGEFDFKKQKEYERKALEDYKRAVEANGKNKDLILKLAGSFMDAKEYKNALEVLNGIQDNEVSAYAFRAKCYYKLHKQKEALENIDKALNAANNSKNKTVLKQKMCLFELKSEINLKRLHFIQAYKDYEESKRLKAQYNRLKGVMPIP